MESRGIKKEKEKIGAISQVCALGSLQLPETKDQALDDKLNSIKISPAPDENKVV